MAPSSRSHSASGTATMKQEILKFPSAKRTASTSSAKKAIGVKTKASPLLADVREEDVRSRIETGFPEKSKQDSPSSEDQTHPELNIKDPRWRKLFADAKAKRNGLPLTHGNKEDEISQILRVFDLNYDYGPCIGVSRLERWERAHALGLNPPPEIRDILSTRQGLDQYSECVFHDEV